MQLGTKPLDFKLQFVISYSINLENLGFKFSMKLCKMCILENRGFSLWSIHFNVIIHYLHTGETESFWNKCRLPYWEKDIFLKMKWNKENGKIEKKTNSIEKNLICLYFHRLIFIVVLKTQKTFRPGPLYRILSYV